MIKTCIPVFIFLVCFADSISLVYDENGNLVTGDGKFREYNSLNQLWKVYNGSDTSLLLAEFTYHPIEERVLKKIVYNTDSSWKETVMYLDENFVRVENSSGVYNYTYVKHEGQLIAQEVGGVKRYLHPDNIGSVTVVTNSTGAVIENTTYSPYRKIISGGTESRYSYEGKERDSTLEMIDFNFRMASDDRPPFDKPDTLIQSVYDPQSLNRYAFERNNPYNNVDEDGHSYYRLLIPLTNALRMIMPSAVRTGLSKIVNFVPDRVKQKWDEADATIPRVPEPGPSYIHQGKDTNTFNNLDEDKENEEENIGEDKKSKDNDLMYTPANIDNNLFACFISTGFKGVSEGGGSSGNSPKGYEPPPWEGDCRSIGGECPEPSPKN